MAQENESKKVAVIAGAGPAGLTAALELLRTTDVKPVIFESEDVIGGISRTKRATISTSAASSTSDLLSALCLMAKMRDTAAGSEASQPSPHTVSVG